ncbi:uncharacterized protein [Pyrus communis]|uniref:uncharacterized protein n=1 Tax=Pyrus communis TaxID=23211 RepID=UPI0035C0A6E5
MSTLPRFVVLKSNHNNNYLRFNIVDADENLKRIMPAARSTISIVLRFRHVHNGKYVALVQNDPNDRYWGFIYTYGESPSQKFVDVFIVMDWESLVPVKLLPKHVAFKGRNGHYLSARLIDQQPHLLYFESNDIEDPSVGNEVFTNADGTPIKVGDNVIALRSMRNNKFRKRNTTSTITSSLNANAPTIDKEAYLEVEEWHFSSPLSCKDLQPTHGGNGRGEAVRTKESYPVEAKLSYTQTTRNDNKVKIGFPGAVQFGETETLREVVYKVVLQAMTRVKVKYVAAEASFDVPFSDTQRDTPMSGEILSSNIDDGVYTGVNTFDFKCHSTEEKL